MLIIEVVPWLYAAANKIRRLAAAAAAEGDGAGHRWQAHRPVTSLIGSLPCWRVVGADGRIIRCCWLHVMGSWEVIQWSPNWRLGLLYGVVKRLHLRVRSVSISSVSHFAVSKDWSSNRVNFGAVRMMMYGWFALLFSHTQQHANSVPFRGYLFHNNLGCVMIGKCQ